MGERCGSFVIWCEAIGFAQLLLQHLCITDKYKMLSLANFDIVYKTERSIIIYRNKKMRNNAQRMLLEPMIYTVSICYPKKGRER